jgi:2-isopropylmalate synthase
MEGEVVKIFDTTLRDGLRNSGITMSTEQKIAFARQLERLNVDAIEIGYGGPSQVETMKLIAQAMIKPVVYGLSRVNIKDVDRILESVTHARKPGVNIFHPVSDDFLRRAKRTHQQAIENTSKAIAYARQHVDHVVFATQDASRAEPAFLVEMCNAVIAAGATTISIADTVSYALPQQFGELCAFLRANTAGGEKVTWSVHCHNDLGLAVANSLAAVEHGVRQVECTINGAGEGAGNTPLQLVVAALQKRDDVFAAITTNINYDQLLVTGQMLAAIASRAN